MILYELFYLLKKGDHKLDVHGFPKIKEYVLQLVPKLKISHQILACPTNEYHPHVKNRRSLNKYHGHSWSEKFNQGKLAKQLSICKYEQVSPIKYGTEPSSEKVTSSSKFKVKINGTAIMKLDGVTLSTELHLEKENNIRQV